MLLHRLLVFAAACLAGFLFGEWGESAAPRLQTRGAAVQSRAGLPHGDRAGAGELMTLGTAPWRIAAAAADGRASDCP